MSDSASNDEANGNSEDSAAAEKFETAASLVAAGNFDELCRLFESSSPHVAQVVALFHLNRLPEVVKFCRDLLESKPVSKHVEAIVRYHLVAALESPEEAEKELKAWSESLDPGGLKDALDEAGVERLQKVKEAVDAMTPDEETRWLYPQKAQSLPKDEVSCSYCSLSFGDKNELRAHCQTDEHQKVLMSDEGRDWKWRPPPRGHSAESYSLCENYAENAICHYGNQCADAHGNEELNEWKDRLEYRKTRLQKAREKELYGKSYTEQILEKWVSASNPDKIMRERVEAVEDSCNGELVTTVASKTSKCEWGFTLLTKRPLKAVAMLQDAHRNHFVITDIATGDGQKATGETLQEWVGSTTPEESEAPWEHSVKVTFSTDIYGTFRQSIVFDFGCEPVLVKHICVDVIPTTDADKIQELKKEIVYSAAERWDDENSEIVHFTQVLAPHLQTPSYLADTIKEKELQERYPCPRASTFVLTQTTITEKKLTKNNYRNRMHELLYVEEIARYEQIARYNLTSTLKITNNYLLTPSGMATSTAKYSHSGELFAILPLSKDVSEDTSAGRLILNNCTTVFISAKDGAGKKRKVYESLIEDKGKNVIYLKLSAPSVTGLGLKAETDFVCDIQFQPSRLSYCEWHQAIDKIADFKIIFPETTAEPSIPWTPGRQWDTSLDSRLNAKQKEAIMAITTNIKTQLPPILLIGPFGTGKTYTLAQALKQLLHQPEARILICTHSNSAADLYIKDYLHPWVEEGLEAAKPLRVYYHKRWVATVNQVVQKYCLIDLNGNVRNFRRPSAEDIMKHRIVVVTLNISMELAALDLPKGYFTHILLDEAAQAMECEAIMPLALASENTRIVLAGDHMQMSPEIFSNFAKERKLHISLLERLYDHYPSDFPCKILLCENYRAHEAIIKFTSELFYEQKLVASGKIPKHDKFYPLTFFTTRGEDVQDRNSTTFYNNSEVYEVVERVSELRKKWPSSWGKINDQSIGIMTPYADQVFRIRSELRKRRMAGISVERVLNVQGKQFRAIFLSTVRTRRTCTNSSSGKEEDVDYGFLSNSKLLNTAITRAQSLVAVVGDPVSLCSIGKCRKIWERFIEICNQNKSLFGITWSLLRSQLDGVELKKTYVLNPNAPEFIPRALQHEAYLKEQTMHYNQHMGGGHGSHHSGGQYHHHPSNYHPPHHGQVSNYRQQSSSMMNQHVMRPIEHGPINAPPAAFSSSNLHLPPSGAQSHPPPVQGQGQFPYQNPQQMYFSNNSQSGMMRGHPPPHIPPQGPPFSQNASAPSNFWGHSPFPQLIPSPGRNTPPGWRGSKPYIGHQGPGIRPPNIPGRQPQMPQQPLRSPGQTAAPMQMPYSMQPKPQTHPQAPPPPMQYPPKMPPQMSPAAYPPLPPTYSEPQHYHQMQEMLQRMPSMAPPAPAPQMAPKMYHDRAHGGATEKDYQFLQNVHFPPEKPPQMPPQRPVSGTDLSYLLPPGMSFYDMAVESKENQIKWFMRLMETQGLEAANKFTEILRQVPTSAAPQPLMQHQAAQQQPPAPKGLASSDQFEIFLDDLMKGSSSTQPLLKDILGYSGASSSGVSSHATSNGGFLSQSSKSSMESELQSVPLYRRQAGQSYSSASSSSKPHSIASSSTPPDLLDHPGSLLDSLEKLSFPNALFGNSFADQNGFGAQGLPSIQSLAANLSSQQHHGHENQLRQHYQAGQQMYGGQQGRDSAASVEDLIRQSAASATYASVLSGAGGMQQQQQNSKGPGGKEGDAKDPFVSQLCASLSKHNGYYNYFE